ncbi:hypothetical protein DCAR_0623936 [Daucus carota subsp. sativus]|uniref:FAF domain-containing protein n=1 Tax=Daucus carota subsp. sativus TaxID=79200 RepID=A0A164VI90_DAUCS|nr:hypothetical protein DCAR_0623936 [Daucus carota subsp. sativus]
MLSFCKKSVYSLFTNLITPTTLTPQTTDHHHTPLPAGLTILTNLDRVPNPSNVIESSSLMLKGFPKIEKNVAPKINNNSWKQDDVDSQGRVLAGFDDDRLASCTELLGFESCDNYGSDYLDKTKTRVSIASRVEERRRERMKMKTKVFPPPLTTLNENGKPVFMLQPERKDGRLRLSVVQVHRRESLRCYRENGRLRMYLVKHDEGERAVNVGTGEDKQGEDRKGKKVAEEERKVPENCGGGEDCRWLSEVAGHHHHRHQHNMHGWGQQSVTIR